DGEAQIDVLAVVAASAALTVSDIPFAGPVGAVRVARLDGKFIINPTYQETEESDLDLRVAGTREAILMVECGAGDVEESVILEGLEAAHKGMQPLLELQEKLRAALGRPKAAYTPYRLPDGLEEALRSWMGDRMETLAQTPMNKKESGDALEAMEVEAVAELGVDGRYEEPAVRKAVSEAYKSAARRQIVQSGQRPDGRKPDGLRPLSAEVDISPRAHGSGLFSRGETQVLTMATLGTPREAQELDGLSPINEKRYIHHYNFPPFSVGEARMLRGASRRDIGHGALAERAMLPVLPPESDFPYTMRLVSEVLSSNGSTSMASVCASTLALLDTGVPIRAAVAGIAMGLVKEGDRSVVLTDIQGVEDHVGDMDFKVAGTRQGVTALQMDIKIKGLSMAVLQEALAQARRARLAILDTIEAAMPRPRPELKEHAPRMTVLKVDPEKIGAIIGPGGKMIRSIQEQSGAKIDIEDDGSVYIAASDGTKAEKARELIERLVESPVIGRIYTGRVVRTTDFGAFVSILPHVDGMVHISQLDSQRVEKVEDVAKVGDELTVMVTNIDPDGKVRLSRTAVLEGWTAEEAIERDRANKRRPPTGEGRGPSSGGRDRGGRSGPSRGRPR
ncbi:MAG: polyribonucleotide nucleotidyltransferase, partial [Anaerolineales bacterium]